MKNKAIRRLILMINDDSPIDLLFYNLPIC